MKGILIVAAVLAVGFGAVGLSLHQACEAAPVNEHGWTDIAGYDSEAMVEWYTDMRSMFSVNHRHPLMTVVLSPLTVVGSMVEQHPGKEAAKRVVIGEFALIGALNFLLLWLVMRRRGGEFASCVCAAVLWLGFAHVWILGGIAESFPVSLAIALGTLLMIAKKVRDHRAWMAMAFLAGSVTVTNVVKPALAWWFGVKGDSQRRRAIFVFALAVAACVAFGAIGVMLKWWLVDDFGIATGARIVFDDITSQLPQDMTLGRRLWCVWNCFWCEPMMLHAPVIAKTTIEVAYSSFVPHVAGFGVLVLCAYSAILNFRDPVVRSALAMFAIDVVLHVLLGWGIEEGQIYCGHWLYLVPVLISSLPRRIAVGVIPLTAVIVAWNLVVVMT